MCSSDLYLAKLARAGTGARELCEIAPQIIAFGVGDIAGEKPREIVEIIAIRRDGETRRAALGSEHFEKRFDMTRYRRW